MSSFLLRARLAAPGSLIAIAGLQAALTLASAANADCCQQQAARIDGRVVDRGGSGIGGVEIRLRPLDRSARQSNVAGDVVLESDDDGNFATDGLAPGLWHVRMVAAGRTPVELELELQPGLNAFDLQVEPAAGTPGTATPAADEAYRRGFDAFREGRYQDAIIAMRELVEVADAERDAPLIAAAWRLIGRSQLELTRLDEATRAYEQLVELTPESVQAHLDLGNVYVKNGDLDNGLATLARALELDPGNAQAHFNVGMVLFEADRLPASIEALTAATVLDPELALAHRALGHAYAESGEFDLAVTALRRYLELAPEAEDADEIREFIRSIVGGSRPR